MLNVKKASVIGVLLDMLDLDPSQHVRMAVSSLITFLFLNPALILIILMFFNRS
jgi:hypothetical protein